MWSRHGRLPVCLIICCLPDCLNANLRYFLAVYTKCTPRLPICLIDTFVFNVKLNFHFFINKNIDNVEEM